jgi:hypothetical protein
LQKRFPDSLATLLQINTSSSNAIDTAEIEKLKKENTLLQQEIETSRSDYQKKLVGNIHLFSIFLVSFNQD